MHFKIIKLNVAVLFILKYINWEQMFDEVSKCLFNNTLITFIYGYMASDIK